MRYLTFPWHHMECMETQLEGRGYGSQSHSNPVNVELHISNQQRHEAPRAFLKYKPTYFATWPID